MIRLARFERNGNRSSDRNNNVTVLYISWITGTFANQFTRIIATTLAKKFILYYVTLPFSSVSSESGDSSILLNISGSWLSIANARGIRALALYRIIRDIRPDCVWQTSLMYPEEIALIQDYPRIIEFTDFPLWPLHLNRYLLQNIKQVDCIVASARSVRKMLESFRSEDVPPVMTISPGYAYDTLLTYKQFSQKRCKRVCYIGSINSRLDFDLIEKVVNDNATVEFIFCGKEDFCNTYSTHAEDRNRWIPLWKSICQRPNVTYLGALRRDAAYQVVQESRIGWIPYRLHEFNKNSLPIKALEYLHLGVNIISTPIMFLSELRDRYNRIFIIYSSVQCSQVIRKVLSRTQQDMPSSVQDALNTEIRAASVESKVSQMTRIIRKVVSL